MNILLVATGSTPFHRSIKRWGVSFLIDEDVLFDTFGKPSVLLENIRALSINLYKIKHIIISHEDWDHITGLWDILALHQDVTVYLCPQFSKKMKEKVHSYGVKVVEVNNTLRIRKNVFSTGALVGTTNTRAVFEQSLILESPNKLAIITGCAHPGIIPIIKHVKNHFRQSPHSILGGLHLKDNTESDNKIIIEQIKKLGIKKIAPTHCTGRDATSMLKKTFGQNFIALKEKQSITL